MPILGPVFWTVLKVPSLESLPHSNSDHIFFFFPNDSVVDLWTFALRYFHPGNVVLGSTGTLKVGICNAKLFGTAYS